jgi:hypothetical protein
VSFTCLPAVLAFQWVNSDVDCYGYWFMGAARIFFPGAARKCTYKFAFKPFKTVFTDRPTEFRAEEYIYIYIYIDF